MTFEELSEVIKNDVVNIAFSKCTIHKFTLELARTMYSANRVKEIYALKKHGLVILLESNAERLKNDNISKGGNENVWNESELSVSKQSRV